MSDLSLSAGIANSGKEYAVKKPVAPKPQEESVLASQGMRESGIEWSKNEKSEFSLMNQLTESDLMLATSTTDTSARVARSGLFSQEMLTELRNKFKKAFVSAYGNVYSHNRLLAKVAEWMVGNVMERLTLMGISSEELDALKAQVRADLIGQNRHALAQVIYDETMLEILT